MLSSMIKTRQAVIEGNSVNFIKGYLQKHLPWISHLVMKHSTFPRALETWAGSSLLSLPVSTVWQILFSIVRQKKDIKIEDRNKRFTTHISLYKAKNAKETTNTF